MKLKTKKKIAKEVIILFSGFLLALIIFLLSYSYNWFYESKKIKLEENINSYIKQSDNLSNLIPVFSKQFYDKLINSKRLNIDEIGTFDTFEENIRNSEQQQKFRNNLLKYKKFNINELKYFDNSLLFFNNILKSENNNKAKVDILKNEISQFKIDKEEISLKILSFEEQKDFGLKTLFIIILILYPVRICFTLIKWAIMTLKYNK